MRQLVQEPAAVKPQLVSPRHGYHNSFVLLTDFHARNFMAFADSLLKLKVDILSIDRLLPDHLLPPEHLHAQINPNGILSIPIVIENCHSGQIAV